MMSGSSTVRVRFPPSPTGYCHVGTARMAIINYLFAKRNGGTIVFRSEDTDRERSKREYEDDIIEQLHWLGLDWDEFYRTTELVENHKQVIQALIDSGRAYISKEPSKNDPGTIVEVVRLRNPGTSITFSDVIRGDITFDTTELGDFVIARAIDDPVYQLAVVVDDAQQGITHVIRGEEHISNTPRQILIQEACGFPRPVYAHYPLLLGTDKSKLSKRKGDVAVRAYREKGYLSEALFNYIAYLGWTPPSQRELMTPQEMISEFELDDLHKSGAVFDIEKLNWFNRTYVHQLDDNSFLDYIRSAIPMEIPEDRLDRALPVIRERTELSSELAGVWSQEFGWLGDEPTLNAQKLVWKESTREESHDLLLQTRDKLADIEEPYDAAILKSALWDFATEKGRGAVLWPMRYALTGADKSPDPFTVAAILGKEEAIGRIDHAIAKLAEI